MKKILILNKLDILVSFKVSYSLSTSQKVIEIKSGRFPSPLFRIIEIPEESKNVITTIKTINSKGKQQIIGEDKKEFATDMFFGVYKKSGKTEFRAINSSLVMGACSIYGVNNSSEIVRATIIHYNNRSERKFYVSDTLKKGNFFAFVVPNSAKETQIKVEKAKDVEKNLWISIYIYVFSNKAYPDQICYEIYKPLFKYVRCNTVNCSKV